MTGKWAWLVAAGGAILLAWLVAERLDSQALAFAAGAVCGVAGSVPAAVLFFWLHQRNIQPPARPPVVPEPAPQVIMVPSAPQAFFPGVQTQYTVPPLERPQREFTIVGAEDEEDGIT